MKQIQATITDQNLNLQQSVISVANSVNAYQLVITYDSDWDEVDRKIVTFSSGNGTNIAVEDFGEGVVIPWEVLQFRGNRAGEVVVGVIGYQGTTLKLTTTGLYKTNVFLVMPEALGLSSAMTPSPDIYQKILQTIGNLQELDTTAKNNLVAAVNEVFARSGVTKIHDDTGAEKTGDVPVKTINGESILGEGDIEIKGGSTGARVEGNTIIFDSPSIYVYQTTIIFEEA